jgi:sugar/nucleoside kinase (ribokinase family)
MSVDVISVGVVCADVMVRPVESLPKRGSLALVPRLELHLGGLAGVTAAVLCRLGAKAAFMGRLGQDGFGDYVLSALESHGVDVSRVRRTAECGTSATVVLISEDGERTFLHHLGANVLTSESDVDFDLVAQAKVLHWGGASITPGLDGEPIGRVFRKARAMGVKTSMDTCFDGKGLWFPHIQHALPHLDIAMSSIEEARHYTGKETPEEIADFYRSFGVESVLVKMGAEGLYVKSGKEGHHIPAHNVPVVDTTGAGDAACGGFLYGIIHGWELLQCGRLANAVGALTVQAMGGSNGVRSLQETLAFMEKA